MVKLKVTPNPNPMNTPPKNITRYKVTSENFPTWTDNTIYETHEGAEAAIADVVHEIAYERDLYAFTEMATKLAKIRKPLDSRDISEFDKALFGNAAKYCEVNGIKIDESQFAYIPARDLEAAIEAELEIRAVVGVDKTLCALLNANVGAKTILATVGMNGNGGMPVDIIDLLDDFEGYEEIEVNDEELAKHIHDSCLEIDPGTVWTAWQRDDYHEDGCRTGGASIIYIWTD